MFLICQSCAARQVLPYSLGHALKIVSRVSIPFMMLERRLSQFLFLGLRGGYAEEVCFADLLSYAARYIVCVFVVSVWVHLLLEAPCVRLLNVFAIRLNCHSQKK
eukprot:gnl/TRDRNA2_/TRDRNA2_164396_c0_seq3.p1 gnl/TRDRNA2_/TRDRNA2_164396_c0~~gnl/TRDRNA2_/TRDRNA2_164396_c0_seq3.p1  ORF type:complete len:105 (+),score=6.75 gnl/TRDRNA2_/TRDRNA2_164396_c0_seq3:63-377(+)